MRRPRVLYDPVDGLAHYVMFLDIVRWRPVCNLVPRYKPKGWKKQRDDQVITCLQCLVGGQFVSAPYVAP